MLDFLGDYLDTKIDPHAGRLETGRGLHRSVAGLSLYANEKKPAHMERAIHPLGNGGDRNHFTAAQYDRKALLHLVTSGKISVALSSSTVSRRTACHCCIACRHTRHFRSLFAHKSTPEGGKRRDRKPASETIAGFFFVGRLIRRKKTRSTGSGLIHPWEGGGDRDHYRDFPDINKILIFHTSYVHRE
jgi:hypothetical protein